jgi:hypothetical protein
MDIVMKHPQSRAERRALRDAVIYKRRFIAEHIWRSFNPVIHEGNFKSYLRWEPFTEWGKYNKSNLNCGCKGCHYYKYFSDKRQRREQLKKDIKDNLLSFEE